MGRASRIRRGMHRLGLVLGAIPLLIAIGIAVAAFFRDERDVFIFALFTLAWAPALYATCWGLGWVIAGFMGDEE